jgi:hypothetical protein
MSQQTQKEGTIQQSRMVKEERKITPLNRIKQHCIWCCGSLKEVHLCPVKDCCLYPFRLGKNPYQKHRALSEEEKKVITQRLQRAK